MPPFLEALFFRAGVPVCSLGFSSHSTTEVF